MLKFPERVYYKLVLIMSCNSCEGILYLIIVVKVFHYKLVLTMSYNSCEGISL